MPSPCQDPWPRRGIITLLFLLLATCLYLLIISWSRGRIIRFRETRIHELELLLKLGKTDDCDLSRVPPVASDVLQACGIPGQVRFVHPSLHYESRRFEVFLILHS